MKHFELLLQSHLGLFDGIARPIVEVAGNDHRRVFGDDMCNMIVEAADLSAPLKPHEPEVDTKDMKSFLATGVLDEPVNNTAARGKWIRRNKDVFASSERIVA